MIKRRIFSVLIASSLWPVLIFASSDKKNENQLEKLRVNADRIASRMKELSEFGKNPDGGMSRMGFSEADIQGRRYIMNLMKEAGLSVRIDAAGNIIGRRKGADAKLPPIWIPSPFLRSQTRTSAILSPVRPGSSVLVSTECPAGRAMTPGTWR